MKVLVTGGRDYANRTTFWRWMDAYHSELGFTLVIHGACGASYERPSPPYQGADGLADEWALVNGILLHRCPADWTQYGRVAGRIRNIWMLEEERPDLIMKFPGGRGTGHMTDIARDAGVPVVEVEE